MYGKNDRKGFVIDDDGLNGSKASPQKWLFKMGMPNNPGYNFG
jgi:hypothetical protein